MRAWSAMVALMACGACASSPRRHARGHRDHPSSRAVHDAFEQTNLRALRCLRTSDRVTVEGAFDGSSGGFMVERIGTASPDTPVYVQQCVALAMEQSRVAPFSASRHDAQWTVALQDISPAVRAMLAVDAGVPPSVPFLGGTIDPARVVGIIQGEGRELRRCYELELALNPRLRGRLELRFTISVDGRISEGVASGPPGFRRVGHCILGRFRQLEFPRPEGGSVDFSFPFHFEPR